MFNARFLRFAEPKPSLHTGPRLAASFHPFPNVTALAAQHRGRVGLPEMPTPHRVQHGKIGGLGKEHLLTFSATYTPFLLSQAQPRRWGNEQVANCGRQLLALPVSSSSCFLSSASFS